MLWAACFGLKTKGYRGTDILRRKRSYCVIIREKYCGHFWPFWLSPGVPGADPEGPLGRSPLGGVLGLFGGVRWVGRGAPRFLRPGVSGWVGGPRWEGPLRGFWFGVDRGAPRSISVPGEGGGGPRLTIFRVVQGLGSFRV